MGNVREVPFDAVGEGWNSSVVTSGLAVVRASDEWERLWQELEGRRQPVPPTPVVDWVTSMVLVFTIGGRPSGGFSASIQRVECDGQVLRVFACEQQPNPTLPAPCVVSSPFHAVTIPRSDLPVELVQRVEIWDSARRDPE